MIHLGDLFFFHEELIREYLLYPKHRLGLRFENQGIHTKSYEFLIIHTHSYAVLRILTNLSESYGILENH